MSRKWEIRWETTEAFCATVTIDDDQIPTEMDVDDLVSEVEDARHYTGTTDRHLIEWTAIEEDVDA